MDGVKHSPTDNKVVIKEAVVNKLITVEQGNVMPSAGGGALLQQYQPLLGDTVTGVSKDIDLTASRSVSVPE